MAESRHSPPWGSGPRYAPLGDQEYAFGDGAGPDGGDVLHLRVHGRIERNELELIFDRLALITVQYGHSFLIFHMVGGGGVSPEARRYYTERNKQQKIVNRWVYVVGASLLDRTIIALVLRGTKLLTGQDVSVPLVKSAAEALALIAERRAQLIASGKPGS